MRNRVIELLRMAMTKARESADGQEREGYIILPREAYEDLYYAAFRTKRLLEAEQQLEDDPNVKV